MAKKEARQLAYIYYVEHGLTGKECAAKAGVNEKTISAWVNRFGWTKERDARIFSANQRAENIKEVLGGLAEESVELTRQLRQANKDRDRDGARELRSSLASIGDNAAKWNKALENIVNKENVSLSVYLTVMEDVFKRMYIRHPDEYGRLIGFQEDLIHVKASELG